MKRSFDERIARVERRLLPAVAVILFLAGIQLGASMSVLTLVVLAVVGGFTLRPAATAVVRRRVSVWALLGDDEPDEPTPVLPPPSNPYPFDPRIVDRD